MVYDIATKRFEYIFFGAKIMPSIGEKIKELRSAKKMTQEALAQNLNVTVSAVSQWESGKTMPDISMLVPLCHMFSVSADDLLGIRIGEQDAVLSETKSEVEKLVANGDYDAAFAELRKKIADFPDNVQFRIEFGLLFMKFCQSIEGREEEKWALCIEVENILIKGNAIDRWCRLSPENEAIADELFLFYIDYRLSDRSRQKTNKLIERVEDLIKAGQFKELRQVVLKELKDAEEVGGPTSRLINYIIAEKLMELNWEHYQKSNDPALLEEIVRCGKFVLEYNAALPLLVKALHYYRKAAEKLGDDEKIRFCDKTLAETQDAVKNFT